MYIIGSVIGGRVSFASTDEHDAMDGELVCRSVAHNITVVSFWQTNIHQYSVSGSDPCKHQLFTMMLSNKWREKNYFIL